MSDSDIDLIVRAVAATLRSVAGWVGANPERADREELYWIADAVEQLDPDDICCPVCEEMTCDLGCPLYPVRSAAQARHERGGSAEGAG